MTLKTEGEEIKISVYPNPMAGFTTGKLKVYALKFYWLEPGAWMMLEIEHGTLSLGEMYMFLAKEDKGCLSQEILVDVSEDRKIGSLWFTNGQKTTINIQRKEHIGYLWKTSIRDAHTSFNKDISAYFFVETFDLIKSIAHLDPSKQVSCYNSLAKWTSVISKNKYDVGLTNIFIRFVYIMEPVSGYVPKMTPAMVNVVNE